MHPLPISPLSPVRIELGEMAGVTIDLDGSFLVQLGIVLLLLALLKQLVFRPYLETLAKREARTDETRAEAGKLRGRAEELSSRYADGSARARAQAQEARQALRIGGAAEKDALVGEARRDGAATVESAHANLEREMASARTRLLGQVEEISRLVVEKVLGRGV